MNTNVWMMCKNEHMYTVVIHIIYNHSLCDRYVSTIHAILSERAAGSS